jgi:hypothetical protein
MGHKVIRRACPSADEALGSLVHVTAASLKPRLNCKLHTAAAVEFLCEVDRSIRNRLPDLLLPVILVHAGKLVSFHIILYTHIHLLLSNERNV